MRLSLIASRVARQLTGSSLAVVRHGHLAQRGVAGAMTHLGGGVRGNGDAAGGKHEAMRGLPEIRHSLVEVS